MSLQLTTGDSLLDSLAPRVENFLAQDQVTYQIDGEPVHGYRSPDCPALWLRDHSDILRGARYFDADVLTGVAHFAATQRANGSLFDFVSCNMDRENWTKYVRVPVEADVEYRFVKGIYLGWQATGDDAWLERMLPHAERALAYSFSHPWRWDEERQLVKRAYTMDTWDFDFVEEGQEWLNFQVTDRTHWGIFHGDNSGFYEACRCLEQLYGHLGKDERRVFWAERATQLGERANELCWNGDFYAHRVPLDGFRMPGVDEEAQLSLSNPMAANRGLASHEMAVSIVDEYRRRGDSSELFAPWYSIDPPFPGGCFGDPLLVAGAYVNGGIMPLVGGELARAALEHGREEYGVSILRQYAALTEERDETYLWYFPDGRPSSAETSTSPEATATDGWGSSAMLYALVEGLAGIVDRDHLFRGVRLAPRWAAAGVEKASVEVGYEASTAGFGYAYEAGPEGLDLRVEGDAELSLHLMLPAGRRATAVHVEGAPISFANAAVEGTPYADAELAVSGRADIRVHLEGASA